jgi:hypothetical protein
VKGLRFGIYLMTTVNPIYFHTLLSYVPEMNRGQVDGTNWLVKRGERRLRTVVTTDIEWK